MANKMWGGRFTTGPAQIMQEINVSIHVDKALYKQDIAASKAHAAMLNQQGIITSQDHAQIEVGLTQILSEIEAGTFAFKEEYEDIHMNVEARLKEIIGDASGRLHTARSRNDQVATDFKLYVRDTADTLIAQIESLMRALATKALDEAATIMPGFTHLMACVEMLARDRSRLQDARKRMNENPLGSAALCGTSFPIDRDFTSRALGFERPNANSLDGVSDRDFVLEMLSSCALTGLHLSRLAEEIVIWSSSPFSFISLSDAFTSGSSKSVILMPLNWCGQKLGA
jgi:argininosuccinate lyase